MSEAAAKEYEKALDRSRLLRTALSGTPFRVATLTDYKVLHSGFTIDENWVGEVYIINEGPLSEIDVQFRAAHRSKPLLVGPVATIDAMLDAIAIECPDEPVTLMDYKDVAAMSYESS